MEIVVISQENGTFVDNSDNDNEMAIPKVQVDKLGINPFLQELVIEATQLVEKGKFVIADDGTRIPSSALVERQKYVRVYRIPGGKDRVLNLSPAAMKMYLYIQYTMDTGDYIQMTPDQYKKATKVNSRTTYKKAVEELQRYGYITTSVQKYVYWVNAAIVTCVNRIAKWPDQVVIKNEL